MIRIKCPKCATALMVEDSAAGGVGECTDCGTRFRIPAAKVSVPARVVAGGEEDDEEDRERVSRRTPPRRRRDEDDEEDSKDELLDPEERERLKRLAQIETDALWLNIKMAASLALAVIVLFISGLFINRLGLYVVVFGAIAFISCLCMVSAQAKRESMVWFLLIWLFGAAMLFVYIILHWQETKKFLIAALAGVILIAVGATSALIYEGKKEIRRAIIRARVEANEKTSWLWQRPGHERPEECSATVAAWVRPVPVPGRFDDGAQLGVTRPPA